MSIEVSKKYEYQPVQQLIKTAVEPWFTTGKWETSQRDTIYRGLEAITGFTRESLLFAQNSELENHEVVATMGGSLAQMASGDLTPEFRMQIFDEILKINTTNKPPLIAQVLEETAHRDLDLDVYLHTLHLEVLEIKDWFILSHQPDNSGHIWVDSNNPTCYIDCSYVKLPNKAEILTFQLTNQGKKIFHSDITKASEDIHSEKRALSGGKQDNQSYPLSAHENDLIIQPNRRDQSSPPENAIPLYEENTAESLLVLTARELLKSLNPLVSNNIAIPADLSALSEKEYFVDKPSLSKISREMSKARFDSLNEEVKKMWLLDVILIATLDPFVAYWYLNVINGVSFFTNQDENPGIEVIYDRLAKLQGTGDENEARRKYIRNVYSGQSEVETFLTLLLALQPQN